MGARRRGNDGSGLSAFPSRNGRRGGAGEVARGEPGGSGCDTIASDRSGAGAARPGSGSCGRAGGSCRCPAASPERPVAPSSRRVPSFLPGRPGAGAGNGAAARHAAPRPPRGVAPGQARASCPRRLLTAAVSIKAA